MPGVWNLSKKKITQMVHCSVREEHFKSIDKFEKLSGITGTQINLSPHEVLQEKNRGVSQQKTVLNTRGTGRAESTQRQLYVFMAPLGVSRLWCVHHMKCSGITFLRLAKALVSQGFTHHKNITMVSLPRFSNPRLENSNRI